MSNVIRAQKVNEVRMRLSVDDVGIREDIYYYFRYEKPNFVPNPFSKWDGIIRMFDKKSGLLDIGLLGELFAFCRARGFTLELDPRLKYMNNVTDEEVMEFYAGLNAQVKTETGEYVPADLRGYQFDSVRTAINATRCVLEAATSAGKSLIIYTMAQYYRMRRQAIESDLKTLIIVPSQHLVVQLNQDFKDYSQANGFNTDSNVHLIYGGAHKDTHKEIIISTWQGIQDQPKDWFFQFGDVIVDEVHLSSADKLSYIMDALIYADQRLGVTGTLGNTALNVTQVIAHFGRVYKIVSARELIEMGYAADINIAMMTLKYTDGERIQFASGEYKDEIDFLISHPARNQLIIDLALRCEGNTIILFDRIEKHMEVIYEKLKEQKEHVYMFNGDVPVKIRDEIKALTEKGDYVTILGSYGTISTGVSIKKLHNLILAHPSKSFIRVVQTLGRMMRMHSSKKVAKIIDIVDDLSWKGYSNHALRHSRERYEFYVKERHPVKFLKKVLSVFTG